MKSWDDEFGYELVDRDKPLEFGSSDAQLEKEIRETIETAHRRQLAIVSRSRFRSTRFGTAWREGRGSSGGGARAGYIPTSTKSSSDHRLQQTSHNQQGASLASYAGGTEAANQDGRASRSADGSDKSAGSSNRSFDGNATGGPGGQGKLGAAPKSASKPRASAGTESIAQTRGANWALPSQTTGARAYVRPIRVGCSRDQLHILSQNQIVATIPLGAHTKDSVDALVSEIWKTIDRWGVAGQNAFWKPELRFSILPGGQQRFEDLQGLLAQAGAAARGIVPVDQDLAANIHQAVLQTQRQELALRELEIDNEQLETLIDNEKAYARQLTEVRHQRLIELETVRQMVQKQTKDLDEKDREAFLAKTNQQNLQRKLTDAKATLAALNSAEVSPKSNTKTETIEHYPNPIARTVFSQEIHFRLYKGRWTNW